MVSSINEANMFKNPTNIVYQDKYVSLKGDLVEKNI